MNHLIDDVKIAISNITSYVSYRKIISENWPDLDNQLASGPYKRYAENLYLFLNNSSSRPNCPGCNKELKYIDRTEGYRKFCSTKCAANSETVKKQHRLAYDNKSIKDKQKIVDKRRETMNDLYGVSYALQSPEFKKKAETKLQQADWNSITEKRKSTIKSKYGVDNVWELENFRNKIKNTNLQKYGVEWVQQNSDVVGKRIKTRTRDFTENLINRVATASPLFDLSSFEGVNKKYKWKCNNCSTEFEDDLDDGSDPVCPKCYPGGKNSSFGEKELVNFLQELGVTNIIQNIRSLIPPKEIDIWLPDYNLAIEYNGLYWHSEERGKNRSYHFNKYTECKNKNIKLIQIFSDEWEQKREIVKNRIKHQIKKSEKLCFARQCVISHISTKDYNQFMEKTHIQGSCVSSVRYGAFYNDKLVACMSFGKNRAIHRSKGWELIRFASSGNIPGVASKLFSQFLKEFNPDMVFSYCDIRWGSGAVYEAIGMNFYGYTSPGYFYSKDLKSRINRFNFTKQKLIAKGFDKTLTERQIIKQLGYYKIWDAGHKKFIWKKPN